MNRQEILTQLIQYHTATDYFDYNHAIEWALNLIEKSNTHKDILMLASFSEPIDSFEIKPYVSRAIRAVELEEKINVNEAENILALLYANEIIQNKEIRKNLLLLKNLCINANYKKALMTFQSLQYTWEEFDYGNYEYPYYDDVTIDTIEETVKTEAKIYIDNFNIADTEIYVYTHPEKQRIPFFKRILSYLKKL